MSSNRSLRCYDFIEKILFALVLALGLRDEKSPMNLGVCLQLFSLQDSLS